MSLLRVQHTSSYRYNAGYCPFESTLLLLSSNSGRETMFGCCWVSCRFLCEEAVSQCWLGERPLPHPKKTNVLPPNGQQSRTAISDPYRLSSDGRHFLFLFWNHIAHPCWFDWLSVLKSKEILNSEHANREYNICKLIEAAYLSNYGVVRDQIANLMSPVIVGCCCLAN